MPKDCSACVVPRHDPARRDAWSRVPVALLVALACLVLPGWFPEDARAARPFTVDDARVVDRGACQVESWYKSSGGVREFWALPACNPFGLELTAGVGAIRHDGGASAGGDRDYQFQVKGLVRELRTNDFGWGLAFGALRHADINAVQNQIGNYYFYAPVSRSFLDDRIVLLTNVGAVDNRDANRRGLTWGVGGEFYLSPRFMLLGEVYGATGFDRFGQAGFRFWVVPDHVQIDSTYGSQLNGTQRSEWFTLGVRLITRPFF